MFLSADFGDIPPVAAQDVINVLKQGYLDKKRKGTAAFKQRPRVKYFYQVTLTVCLSLVEC